MNNATEAILKWLSDDDESLTRLANKREDIRVNEAADRTEDWARARLCDECPKDMQFLLFNTLELIEWKPLGLHIYSDRSKFWCAA